ncbi:TIGR00730 family Rossman fold protein [Porticoccus litoralis]|uniref:Cytokinin riboside 5'-monophosphate phosphoribohydrolase n=1 Tax=Porticoccus litoralis TaxID=434086 RepID=A0AAW8B7Z1_9GAMM|nr:TIGR00730 family Rossman fold protein [Porticoccus litoralis]MDP1521209.1 TIGR00730 family Rossman fold protein [Porticoccus litoralis]
MDENKIPEAWRVLRIQAELVDGIEALAKLGSAVTIFGGARFKPGSHYYEEAQRLGGLLGKEGIPVITGGGPGIMEAANRGCHASASTSVGLNISLPTEQDPNSYLDLSLKFRYFFVRKFMFVKHAVGFVIFPGGYGTLDELFEALTLVQTSKVRPFPIILVGSDYWGGLVDWIQNTMLANGCIAERELHLFTVVDDAESAAKIILQHARMLQAQEIAE